VRQKDSPPVIGQTISHYRVIEKLGGAEHGLRLLFVHQKI
jgi:hypothetical protein